MKRIFTIQTYWNQYSTTGYLNKNFSLNLLSVYDWTAQYYASKTSLINNLPAADGAVSCSTSPQQFMRKTKELYNTPFIYLKKLFLNISNSTFFLLGRAGVSSLSDATELLFIMVMRIASSVFTLLMLQYHWIN